MVAMKNSTENRTGRLKGPAEVRFWACVRKTDFCWEWTGGKDSHGYGHLRGDDWHKRIGAHRFSYMLHNGPIARGLEVLHNCDNPGCVNPSHLRLGTHRENMQDMIRKGRKRAARRQGRVSGELVRAVIAAYRHETQNLSELGRRFGVNRASIRRWLRSSLADANQLSSGE